MGELRVSTLEDVYKMTWREFQLRLMAYKRQVKDKHLIARQMTYYAGYAMHTTKAKPIDQFWSIDVDKPSVSDEMKNRMRKILERERAKVKK